MSTDTAREIRLGIKPENEDALEDVDLIGVFYGKGTRIRELLTQAGYGVSLPYDGTRGMSVLDVTLPAGKPSADLELLLRTNAADLAILAIVGEEAIAVQQESRPGLVVTVSLARGGARGKERVPMSMEVKLYYLLTFQTKQVEATSALMQTLLQYHKDEQLAGVVVREVRVRKDELMFNFESVEERHEPLLRTLGIACFASGLVSGISLSSGYSNY
jgi:hypothetical protein